MSVVGKLEKGFVPFSREEVILNKWLYGANCLLPLPDDIDLDYAAGLPYASCSIWSALFKTCDLQTIKDKRILIREGPSWIGALAIQYAKYMGLKVIAATGSSELVSICNHYGADFSVDDTSRNFVTTVTDKTGRKGKGVDFVLAYGVFDLQANINCCRTGGKVVIVDFHGTDSTRIDLALLQEKHAEIKVFDLQFRDLDYLASVIAEVRIHLWPLILEQKVVRIDKHRFPLIEAQKALDLFRKHDGYEKITIFMDFEKACRHRKMN
ncbi:uncharacterized protein [Henckelia pumila]|uniref:uncharacterized protein isoform X2 n=1 Tax=Henckelia pumila TaxID=405737 RepID=UPI003C6DDBD4